MVAGPVGAGHFGLMAADQSSLGQESEGRDVPGSRETEVARSDPTHPGHHRLRRLERLAWLLDDAVPVGRFRMGLDPVLGLIPGLGDSIGALLSLYVMYEGARLGAPKRILFRMTGNILVETVLGAIPVLGDVFDFIWQANSRNMRLVHQHHAPNWQPRPLRAIWLSVFAAAALVLAVVIGLAWLMFHALAALIGSG